MTSALLIRLGGLGDLLVALPALRLVRAFFPDASLHLLARKEYGGLLREAGVVDLVLSADEAKWMPLFDAGGPAEAPDPLPAEFRREISRHDWIAGWFHGGKNAAPGYRGGAGENAGPGLRGGTGQGAGPGLRGGIIEDAGPGYRGGAGQGAGAFPFHAFLYDPASGAPLSRYFFDRTMDVLRTIGRPAAIIAASGLDDAAAGPVASFDDCRLLFPADRTRRERFAVIHPGSGSPKKCWPLDRFRRVIGLLGDRGLGGFLVSGEAEAGLEESLGRLALPPGWRRLARPPLSDLARLLRAAAVYVGNDSGPTHLAAACGAETIAVFRGEFAPAWAPFGRCTVLSAPSVEEVAAEDVIAVLAKVLKFQVPLC